MPMTPNITPTIVPTEKSLKCNDGAPFHTIIIYISATAESGNTVRIPVVNAKYSGIIFRPAVKLFLLFKTVYFVKRKMMAATDPAITGAITQEARISPSPYHPQRIPLVPNVATPMPTTEPTIV
jgi:hypothetical protein